MNKVLVLSILGCLLLLTACNEKELNEAQVPGPVKAGFRKEHPGIAPKWEKEDEHYEASFNKEGTDMSVLVQKDGIILETEAGIKEAGLPAAALAYLKEHYAGKKIKEAARIVKADSSIIYEAEVNGKDILFDLNGNFIKEQ